MSCHIKVPSRLRVGLNNRSVESSGMSESSDRELLDLIRRSGPLTVAEMGDGSR